MKTQKMRKLSNRRDEQTKIHCVPNFFTTLQNAYSLNTEPTVYSNI